MIGCLRLWYSDDIVTVRHEQWEKAHEGSGALHTGNAAVLIWGRRYLLSLIVYLFINQLISHSADGHCGDRCSFITSNQTSESQQ